MRDAPLVIPILIEPPKAGSSRPTSSSDRLSATWTSRTFGRRVAVVDEHNSVWISSADKGKGKGSSRRTLQDGEGDHGAESLSIAVPDITLNNTSSGPLSAASPRSSSSRTHTPTTPTSSSTAGPSKPHRPSQLRSHSSASVSYGALARDREYGNSEAHRSRAASNASSILSSGSYYRRSSALSPPAGSPRLVTTALTTETASADPHAGHRHGRTASLGGTNDGRSGKASSGRVPVEQSGRASLSENAELLDQLKHQCRPVSPAADRGGIGLGIGLGLGSRGLAVHGKANDGSPAPSAEAAFESGALSPRSTHSFESSRTLSNRFMPWRGDEEVKSTQEKKKELMEKVAEVEVEREMEREVAEDAKEKQDEKLVRDAQEGYITPRGSMVLDEQHHAASTGTIHDASNVHDRMKRLILPDWTQGAAVRMLVVCEIDSVILLRDTGVLDIISLSTETIVESLQLEHLEDAPNPASTGGDGMIKLHKFWKWKDVHMNTVDNQVLVIAHGIPWSSGGMPSPNGQVTRVVMLRAESDAGAKSSHGKLEMVAGLELAGVGDVATNTTGSSIIHSTEASTFSYPITSPSSRPVPTPKTSAGTGQNRSASALLPTTTANGAANMSSSSSSSQDGLRRHRSQLLARDGPASSSSGQSRHGPRDGERERGFAKFLGIKRDEVPEGPSVEVGWGFGAGTEVENPPLQQAAHPSTHGAAGEKAVSSPSGIAAIVSLDVETCFVADRNGELTKQRLADVIAGRLRPTETATVDRLESAVTCMTIVQPERDGAYLVVGDEDGIVRIWDAQTFELLAMLSLFAFPVVSVSLLDMPQAGTLRGQMLCTSKAGTIAMVSLEEMDQSFLIPASRDPLRKLFVGGKDIMMMYANGKARVWNVETLEFRRSTALDAAEDMLNAGDWREIDLKHPAAGSMPLRNTSMEIAPDADTSRLLELDLRQLGPWLRAQRASTSKTLDSLRALLPLFLTRGIDEGVDRICQQGLGICWAKEDVQVGCKSTVASGVMIDQCTGADRVWCISPEATGMRQLAIVTLLRPFLDHSATEASAAQAIAFYTAALPPDTVDADLRFFGRYYLDTSHDVHLAAHILFDSRMDRMSAEEVEHLAEEYIPRLPSQRPPDKAPAEGAGMALTILGGMALHRYQHISPSALKAVAESITIYLASDLPDQLGLAIELASKGFSTWQTFIDPAEMLRRLFYLATHNPSHGGEAPTAQNHGTASASNSSIAAQARLAVLHVASSNPALFMSTLSMDIVDAKTVEGRKSIMKLCVYMARKKPEVLENSLPKIVEAVVKSLDPNVGKMREDVQQTATVILSELVLAFTTVDFQSSTQRLAMGTHEGAVVMYDLKTASRLYVLEPHKHPVSAVMFSPDGRRLVTVSLEEGDITVWKVGSSLSGFFNVGGPPRQGGKAGEPFKRIEFARADNGPLKSTTALSDIQITWPGQKQVKIVIKETALTFET